MGGLQGQRYISETSFFNANPHFKTNPSMSQVRISGLNSSACQVWKLILVEADGVDTSSKSSSDTFGLDVPPYDGK